MSEPSVISTWSGSRADEWVGGAAAGSRTAEIRDAARRIIDDVRARGDAAVLDASESLDGVRPASLLVSPERCAAALEALPDSRRRALERARRNIQRVHSVQRHSEPAVSVEPGIRAWREFRPIQRVGLYVPGGRASYPSSLLMAAVPAGLAGCSEIVVASPPAASGAPADAVLAVAALLGVQTVYAAGGVQAIAALALGTESLARVDKVIGPGSRWVDAAKLELFPEVAIDLPAGPSEVVVWADESVASSWIAGELLAQAEHGSDSLAVGVLASRAQAASVTAELSEQLVRLERRQHARDALSRSALLVAEDDARGLAWVNRLAAEHVVLMRRDAAEAAGGILNAGSVFVGPYSPVAAGDYAVGTNHILPTGGRARASGGLAVEDFGRWIQFQELEREGLAGLAPTICELAAWEGFGAHAESVRMRLEGT